MISKVTRIAKSVNLNGGKYSELDRQAKTLGRLRNTRGKARNKLHQIAKKKTSQKNQCGKIQFGPKKTESLLRPSENQDSGYSVRVCT
jgi:hypothetical protein